MISYNNSSFTKDLSPFLHARKKCTGSFGMILKKPAANKLRFSNNIRKTTIISQKVKLFKTLVIVRSGIMEITIYKIPLYQRIKLIPVESSLLLLSFGIRHGQSYLQYRSQQILFLTTKALF